MNPEGRSATHTKIAKTPWIFVRFVDAARPSWLV